MIPIMTNNLNSLASRVKQDLTNYQRDVSKRLTVMLEEGSISPIEKEKIVREAFLTSQEILTTLQSPTNQSEELTEMYIYALVENYKHSVELKLNPQPSFNPFEPLFNGVSSLVNKLGIKFNNSPNPKRKKHQQSKVDRSEVVVKRLAQHQDNNDEDLEE
jgi:hypothetical protein